MSRVGTLVALTAAALLASAGRASAANVTAPAPATAREGVVNAVTAVSIVPSSGRAEVVVAVSGPVEVSDFALTGPDRVVLDLTGAKLSLPAHMYDKVSRAGITNVRLAQYKPDVVRLVLELDSARDYEVTRTDNEIRIAVTGTEKFTAWHAGDRTQATSAGTVARTDDRAAARSSAVGTRERLTFNPQRSQQPRITVTYQNSDIRDVIAAFATFSQRTIVIGKDVQGTVTAEIKDQPWDVALQAVLQAQGLAASEENTGIISVDSYANILAKEANEPLTTQLVAINYASASSLTGTIASLLSKDCSKAGLTTAASGTTGNPSGGGNLQNAAATCIVRGGVVADTSTNTLLVTEVASRMPDLMSYIKDLDVRTPQVALRAKIISVNRTSIEQLGVSYDLASPSAFFNTLAPHSYPGIPPTTLESQVELGGEALAGVANASRKYKVGSALNLLFSTAIGKFSLTTFLDALRENQLADLQAEPSIVTLDNRVAEILVGQETPVRVIDAGSAGQVGVTARANVQFKESGIILRVTPHITSNRQIRMTVHAEQSKLNVVGGDLGFFFDKSRADNQLLVSDGETAVIGGLTQTAVTRNRSGIPYLSELPLIGRLFAQTDTREEKRDLLVLITPHIIDEGEAVRPPGGAR
ncbi:MAG TPA: AMIN domain-containing protein [Gemmatimonadaceae bacterium]|nr:AMIN domain-containing protein [Gemmatimonadaceae bacterium]